MNNRKHLPAFTAICLGFLALFGAASFAAAATWSGGSPTTNGWSDGLNWDTATAPGPADSVLFANSTQGATNVAGAVNNTVNLNFTVSSMTNQTTSPNGFHTTFINPGVTLNISGSGGNALYVGAGITLPVGTETVNSRFVGPGTLAVTNTTGMIGVVNFTTNTAGFNADHRATLDLSGLTNFAADVSQVLVAQTTLTGEAYLMGALLLAETNFIHTAAGTSQPGIGVGVMHNGTTQVRGTQQFFLGNYNLIQSDAITIGGTKLAGQMSFRTGLSNGVATFRGSAGGTDRVKLFSVGDERAGVTHYGAAVTGVGNSGVFDSTGNFVDIRATDLYVARAQTNNNGATTGTLTFDQGTIDADNAFVGFHSIPSATTGATIAFNATGTLNVNGNATLTVNNNLVLAQKGGTNIPVATLNLTSNGTVNVTGSVVTSGGTSTINVASNATVNVGNITNSSGTSTINAGGAVNVIGNIVMGSGTSTLNVASNATVNVQGNITNSSGTSTINAGGPVNVIGNIVIGSGTTTLNVASNATVSVRGNITNSSGTSTINFNNGGTINLQPAGDATPGDVRVSTLNFNTAGLLTNANRVTVSNLNGVGTIATAFGNVTNVTTLNPGTIATAGTLSVGANFTLATNAILFFNLTNVTTVGANANDLISVTGDLNLNSNGVVFIPTVATLASGSYRLFDYTGARNGFLNFTNSTRYTASLDYPANQVNVTVSGSGGSVRWIFRRQRTLGPDHQQLVQHRYRRHRPFLATR